MIVNIYTKYREDVARGGYCIITETDTNTRYTSGDISDISSSQFHVEVYRIANLKANTVSIYNNPKYDDIGNYLASVAFKKSFNI